MVTIAMATPVETDNARKNLSSGKNRRI